MATAGVQEVMMRYMLEVYRALPVDHRQEAAWVALAAEHGGRMTYREEPPNTGQNTVCLTFEFDGLRNAEAAAEHLRHAGVHVEGPVEYASE